MRIWRIEVEQSVRAVVLAYHVERISIFDDDAS